MVAGLAVLFIVAFILMMQYTKPGRAMRAMAQDRTAAQLMGVPVQFYGLVGFALGAMLAGLVAGFSSPSPASIPASADRSRSRPS